MKRFLLCTGLLTLLLAVALLPARVDSCPFCSAVSMTLGEELKSSDIAVIATLVDHPVQADPNATPAKSKFKIEKVLKGEKSLAGKTTIEMLYFGTQDNGAKFLVFAIDPKDPAWGTPTALSETGVKYLDKVAELPETPADRLAFFQEYFEDADPLLSGDAFNEFAKAPYADVAALKDKMHRDKLVAWIQDDKIPASRRRLYLTMLGMCGTPAEIPLIEGMIKTDDRQVRTALDAMIGCYLSLKGADGLPLIEDLFLKNDKSEYVDTYSAIVALRVLGQETTLIPKERLVGALRTMLDRPQLADLVIPDLARWQDWGAMDKLVDLFKNANEESSWVRVPVVQFLRACPDPKAQEYLRELAQIDPDAVKRATNYLALPGLAGGGGAPPAAAKAEPQAPPAASGDPAAPPADAAVEKPAPPAVGEPTQDAGAAKAAAPGQPGTLTYEVAAAADEAKTPAAFDVTAGAGTGSPADPATVLEAGQDASPAAIAAADVGPVTTDKTSSAATAQQPSARADVSSPETVPTAHETVTRSDWSVYAIVGVVLAAAAAFLFMMK